MVLTNVLLLLMFFFFFYTTDRYISHTWQTMQQNADNNFIHKYRVMKKSKILIYLATVLFFFCVCMCVFIFFSPQQPDEMEPEFGVPFWECVIVSFLFIFSSYKAGSLTLMCIIALSGRNKSFPQVLCCFLTLFY